MLTLCDILLSITCEFSDKKERSGFLSNVFEPIMVNISLLRKRKVHVA